MKVRYHHAYTLFFSQIIRDVSFWFTVRQLRRASGKSGKPFLYFGGRHVKIHTIIYSCLLPDTKLKFAVSGWRGDWDQHIESDGWHLLCHTLRQNSAVSGRVLRQAVQRYEPSLTLLIMLSLYCFYSITKTHILKIACKSWTKMPCSYTVKEHIIQYAISLVVIFHLCVLS